MTDWSVIFKGRVRNLLPVAISRLHICSMALRRHNPCPSPRNAGIPYAGAQMLNGQSSGIMGLPGNSRAKTAMAAADIRP
jgi:hypothetical protein